MPTLMGMNRKVMNISCDMDDFGALGSETLTGGGPAPSSPRSSAMLFHDSSSVRYA